MLVNFMHLVTAVVLAGLWRTTSLHVDIFEAHMRRYLETLVDLFPEGHIVPNHHLTLHIPDLTRLFGAVPGWRSFGFERFNFLLQEQNTNLNFGTSMLSLLAAGSASLCNCRRNGVDFHDDVGQSLVFACQASRTGSSISSGRVRGHMARYIWTGRARYAIGFGVALSCIFRRT